MATDPSYSYNSYIKNIYLELPRGYHFNHQSLGRSEKESSGGADDFLGRTKITDSFRDVLNSTSTKGAYLVTGYRGMGKTSFVNHVLKPLEDAQSKDKKRKSTEKPVKVFRLSLAQSELKDLDIFKHIVSQLLKHIEGESIYHYTRIFSLSNVFGWLLPIIIILFINYSLTLIVSPGKDSNEASKTIIENLLGITSVSALITLFFYRVIDWFFGRLSNTKQNIRVILSAIIGITVFVTTVFLLYYSNFINLPKSITSHFLSFSSLAGESLKNPLIISFITTLGAIGSLAGITLFITNIEKFNEGKVSIKVLHEQLRQLQNRCNAQMTSEDQFKETFASSISSLFRRDIMTYPIANAKEVEAELIDLIKDLKEHFKYIFVFDELDKIDPDFDRVLNSDVQLEKRARLNDLRERRHLITNILGSLKYFINEAEAKFIFIAGREMFEAALADISDRQSSISSIFHRVIYVDSFLKDQSLPETVSSSIGILVEKYLSDLLLPVDSKQDSAERNAKNLSSEGEEETNINFFSNYYKHLIDGSDQKATDDKSTREAKELIKKEARKSVFVLQNFLNYLVYRSNGSPKKMFKLLEEYIIRKENFSELNKNQCIIIDKKSDDNKKRHFLYFSYYDQYKLGFTAYLFQPFLTMYSSFMKRYSDNTLVSTPYLIDNLIKFHPFAFSAQNLELIPEILSTNKSPISRPFLEELIEFLGENHIRRTESGLFEYKFYDRTHNEITFISKLFEDEAAAFNFTLDENYTVKSNLITKIRQLRDSHSNKASDTGKQENPISSIIFLNRLLGDVRFQDEEYEDAIVSYQDAIQMLSFDRLEYSNYLVTFIRLKLKLGLSYEKIKAYEFALGHYAGVIEQAGDSITKHAKNHEIIYRELLVLVMQAYSATLYLQEKLQEGITFQKLKHVINGFNNLLNRYEHDYKDQDIIMANFYSNVGTALYYKNMVLPQYINELKVLALKRKKVLDSSIFLTIIARITGQNTEKERIEDAVLQCFPQEILSRKFINISIAELETMSTPASIAPDARISTTTYIYYKLTLKTLLNCESDSINDLLKTCSRLIRANPIDEGVNSDYISYRSLQTTHRLTNIGNALAKLGDYLLPMAKQEAIDIKELLSYFRYSIQNKSGQEAPDDTEVRSNILFYYFNEKYTTKSTHPDGNIASDLTGKIHPRLIIHIYYLASQFYLDGDETANGAFQLKKILFTIRSLSFSKQIPSAIGVHDVLDKLKHNLVKRILELSSWMSHSSDRPELSKLKSHFAISTIRTPHDKSNELYGNLSNSPDTKETVLAYALLKITNRDYRQLINNFDIETVWDIFKAVPEHKLLSPYTNINHHIIRIMELELHTNMNYKILHSYTENRLAKLMSIIQTVPPKSNDYVNFILKKGSINNRSDQASWESIYFHATKLYDITKSEFAPQVLTSNPTPTELEKLTRQDELLKILSLFGNVFIGNNTTLRKNVQGWLTEYCELVVNSIFNLIQIDLIINTYGINYILSYSYMGQIHQYLGDWIKHLHLCRILVERCKLSADIDIDKMLEGLIGTQQTTTLDALTSYQVAIQFYYQAIQLHKEGGSYRHQINNLVYLEDDYNDNLYHFGAALERFRINSKTIRKKIDLLKEEIKTANMYKYSTYIGEQ